MRKVLGLTAAVVGLATLTLAFHAVADEPTPPVRLFIYSGIIRSIDRQARTIMVEGSAISQKFLVPTDAEIIVKDKPRGDLSDLMVGDGVEVKYTEDEAGFVAHRISLLGLKTQ